jgi:hypothetical protein
MLVVMSRGFLLLMRRGRYWGIQNTAAPMTTAEDIVLQWLMKRISGVFAMLAPVLLLELLKARQQQQMMLLCSG